MLDVIHQALRRGDAPAAERAAREGLSALPSNPDLHHLLAVSLQQLRRWPEAQAALQQALMLAPDRAAFHVTRAQFALATSEVASARADLQRAVQLDPNSLAAYLALARIELAEGNLDSAESHLKFARRVGADRPETLLLEGQLQLARQQPDTALNYFNAAAKLLPNDPMVQISLAAAYEQRGMPALAEDALRNAIKLRPDAASTRRQLINLLAKEARLDEARDEFKILLEQHPNDAGAWRALGQLQLGRRDVGAAIGAFHRSLSLFPRQTDVLRVLHEMWAARDAADEARAFLDSLIAQHRGEDLLWDARYRLDAMNPVGPAILKAWSEALPNSLAALEATAQRADLEARGDEAETLADQVLARDPRRVGAALVKARAELRRDPATGEARLSSLLADSKDPILRRTLLGLLGLAASLRQSPSEAIARWTEAWTQTEAGLPLPAFLPPGPTVTAPDEVSVPRLLCLFPGVQGDAICAALAESAPVVIDRFGVNARNDGLGPLRPKDGHHGEQGADAIWRAKLAERGQTKAQVIDVLPHVDAEIFSALPHSRLVVALADPRDMLLNWLAFGSAQRFAVLPLTHAASWLAQGINLVLDLQQSTPERIHLLRSDALDADPLAALAEAAGFWALETSPSQFMPVNPGALAQHMSLGQWRAYSDVLAEPFAILAPVAARLGYSD